MPIISKETHTIALIITIAAATSTIIMEIEIETISTTKITREIIATTEIGISEMITTELTRNVTAAENQPMDGEEEYDKHIVQLGARYATIAD